MSRVLNSLVRKRVLWAYADGTYALIDPSTGYPAPSAKGRGCVRATERASSSAAIHFAHREVTERKDD